MKGRRRALGAVFIGLSFILGILLLVLPSFPGGGDDLVMMPGVDTGDSEPAANLADANKTLLQTVTVDRSNVQRVVGTLGRPARYTLTAKVTTLYTDGQGAGQEQTLGVVSQVDGSLGKTELFRVTGEMWSRQKSILTNADRIYIWEPPTQIVYEGRRGDFSIDDLGHMPTYEELLTRSASSILKGSVDRENDWIEVESVHPESGYTESWRISIAWGLLMEYHCRAGEELIFSAQVTQVSDTVEENTFLLPDGTAVGAG